MEKKSKFNWSFRRGHSVKRSTLVALVGAVIIVGLGSLSFWYPRTTTEHKSVATIQSIRESAEPPKMQAPIPAVQAAESKPIPETGPASPKKAPRAKHAKPTPQKEEPLGISAKGEFKWQHFGVAPYASTRAEAMRSRESAFRKLGFPNEVVKELVRATENPGVRMRLNVGDRLDAMLSRGSVLNKNIVVAFIRPPVSGKMEYAAPAESWQVVWKGQTYMVILPDICNNWSRRDAPAALRSFTVGPSECVEVSFNAPVGGHVRWGVGTTKGPLPPDACNAQRQGGFLWTAWYGECDVCVPALDYIESVLGTSASVPHKYYYPVSEGKQVLRFSRAVWQSVVYVCLEYPDGADTCGVYIRPQDWKGRSHVELPDTLWQKNDGNCPS